MQIRLLPVNDAHADYAYKLCDRLRAEGLRVEVDARSEKVGKKVRDSVTKKTPYSLVLGAKEVETGELSIRKYGGDEVKMTVEDFVKQTVDKVAARDEKY